MPKLREAVDTIKKAYAGNFVGVKLYDSCVHILLSFTEAVLSASSDWPSQEKIRPPETMLTPQQESWNKSLDAALIAHVGIVDELHDEIAELKNQLSNYKFLSQFTPDQCRYLESHQKEMEEKITYLKEEIDRLKK